MSDDEKVKCKTCHKVIGYIRFSHGPFELDCVECWEEDQDEEEVDELDLEDDPLEDDDVREPDED